MKLLITLGLMTLLLVSLDAYGATYSITTNAAGEAVLDRAIATGGTHDGLTKLQVIQKFVNTDLLRLFNEQTGKDSRELDDKLRVTTNAAKVNARAAINAGIAAPTVATIPNQTNQVNDVVSVPLSATDPDGLPLVFVILNGPPGVRVGSDDVTGAPMLKGAITSTGTFPTVTVRAYKFSDVFGSTTFSWTVNP